MVFRKIREAMGDKHFFDTIKGTQILIYMVDIYGTICYTNGNNYESSEPV